MKINEGDLEFEFFLENVIKFDETHFYDKKFNVLDGSKGVDFLAYDENNFIFIEVKDFKGYEQENRKRISLGQENSLDIEIAKKVRSSLSCLFASAINLEYNDLKEFSEKLKSKHSSMSLKIILFLEQGNMWNTPNEEKRNLRNIKNRLKKSSKRN
jgi:hypothetical protein